MLRIKNRYFEVSNNASKYSYRLISIFGGFGTIQNTLEYLWFQRMKNNFYDIAMLDVSRETSFAHGVIPSEVWKLHVFNFCWNLSFCGFLAFSEMTRE
jgi:hypothetical protein